jgi:hypothetical protein
MGRIRDAFATVRTAGWPAIAVGLTVVALALVRPTYNFGVVFGIWQPFTRPPGVSAAARYVSDVEGGTWFDCSVDTKRNVDVCSAWDPDGRALGGGDFRLECEGRAATKSELKPSSVISSDGQSYMIYLYGKDGAESRTLVSVTRDGKGGCPFQVTITYPDASLEPSQSPHAASQPPRSGVPYAWSDHDRRQARRPRGTWHR